MFGCHSTCHNLRVCVCANSHVLSKRKFQKNHGELNPRCLHELPIHYHLSHSVLSIWVIILPKRCSKVASKCEKITQKWQKRAKGCALSKPRQYFSWGARKKNTHFFTKKLRWQRIEPRIIWWEATALPTEPQRRSHWTKLKTWSHSYLGREIFSGSKLCLEATLHFTMCVCVCVHVTVCKNLEKFTGNWTPDVCMRGQYTTKWAIQDFQFEWLFYQISALSALENYFKSLILAGIEPGRSPIQVLTQPNIA